MQPIPTEGMGEVLRDPHTYFEETLPWPVLHIFSIWADRLMPEMTPTDFILSYYGVLQDIQERKVQSPLNRADPKVYRLLFLMFPTFLPTLVQHRAKEVAGLWQRIVREVGVGKD